MFEFLVFDFRTFSGGWRLSLGCAYEEFVAVLTIFYVCCGMDLSTTLDYATTDIQNIVA